MKSVLLASLIAVSIFAACSLAVADNHNESTKEGVRSMESTGKSEVATLAGGCFWGLEAGYNELRGVGEVVLGYSGGRVANPTYEEVCTGKTGHAESIQIKFDPQVITYKELLEVFFTIHDPTTLNRQGADVGTQYRSAIFYQSPEQKAVAEKV